MTRPSPPNLLRPWAWTAALGIALGAVGPLAAAPVPFAAQAQAASACRLSAEPEPGAAAPMLWQADTGG
jgi:hypothetical protein